MSAVDMVEPTKGPEELRHARSLESIKRKRAFKSHLLTYVLVNAFLWAVWAVTSIATGSWMFPWPIFPMAGWGISVGILAWNTYRHGEITQVDDEAW